LDALFMSDSLSKAKRFRERAEECTKLAELATSEKMCRHYKKARLFALIYVHGATWAELLGAAEAGEESVSMSKFESCDRGSLDTNSDAQREDAAASARVAVAHALHDPGMIARR
jgi:hypothetical protein